MESQKLLRVARFLVLDVVEYFDNTEDKRAARLEALEVLASPEHFRAGAVDKSEIMKDEEDEEGEPNNSEGITAEDVASFSPRDDAADALAFARCFGFEEVREEFAGLALFDLVRSFGWDKVRNSKESKE